MKRAKYKNTILAILSVLYLLVFILSCSLNGQTTTPVAISSRNSKTLFIANNIEYSKQISQSKNTSNSYQLFSLGQDSVSRVVVFYDSNGNQIDAKVNTVYTIKKMFSSCSEYFGISLEINGVIHTYLVDNSTGKMYDFSSYNIQYTLIYNNTIYTERDGTVYWISIADMSKAYPMNNGAIDPISAFVPLPSGDIISLIGPFIDTNTANQYQSKVYFKDTSKVPIKVSGTPAQYYNRISWIPQYMYSTDGILYDTVLIDQTDLYLYRIDEDSTYGIAMTQIAHLGVGSLWGVYPYDCGYSSLSQLFIDRNCLLPTVGGAGLLKIDICSSNIPVVSTISESFPYDTTNRTPVYIVNKYYYYYSDNCIYEKDLEAGSSLNSIYSNDNIIGTYWLMGNFLYFYQYISGTNIGTYRINKDNPIPELVSNSQIGIESIAEIGQYE